jgi:hypothetical protein
MYTVPLISARRQQYRRVGASQSDRDDTCIYTDQIRVDHSDQMCCPTGQEANTCARAHRIASKSALGLSCHRSRCAESNTEGLGHFSRTVMTHTAQIQVDHSDQICCLSHGSRGQYLCVRWRRENVLQIHTRYVRWLLIQLHHSTTCMSL